MNLTFALVTVLLLFCMLTWVLVTVCRIYFPEQPLPVERDPVLMRHAIAGEEGVPVGARVDPPLDLGPWHTLQDEHPHPLPLCPSYFCSRFWNAGFAFG